MFPIGGTDEILEGTSRGLIAGDVNNDGGVDLLVVNRDASPFLLINQRAGPGNWLLLQLHDSSGRDAYGAELTAVVGEARIFLRVRPEGSYLSSSDPRLHIGLGVQETLKDVLGALAYWRNRGLRQPKRQSGNNTESERAFRRRGRLR